MSDQSDPSNHIENIPVVHNEPAPAEPGDLTPKERLNHALSALRKRHSDYDPLLEIADIAMEARESGDLKTALAAHSAIADRLYPKLRSVEVKEDAHRVPEVIELRPTASQPDNTNDADRRPSRSFRID